MILPQVSPLVLIASGFASSCFASTANFQPPYSWLTTALRVSTVLSFSASEYMERSLSGSDSFYFREENKSIKRMDRDKNEKGILPALYERYLLCDAQSILESYTS